VLEYDAVLRAADGGLPANARDLIEDYRTAGFKVFAIAWRPQISEGLTTEAAVLESFERTKDLLGVNIEFGFCPHPAGPPICWCRKQATARVSCSSRFVTASPSTNACSSVAPRQTAPSPHALA
jgi:hypothetical protein